ncbi:MAG: response regulator [Elusimicrobia bacterium]|nr:response regulator [Elusimicrobiota bacterium]
MPREIEPLFAKAQEVVGAYFASLRLDPAKGTTEIGDERYLLVRAASLSVELFEALRDIYKDLGEDAEELARQFLFDMAHFMGSRDARYFHRKLKLTNPVDKLSAGPVHFAYSGWAFVDISPESRLSPDEDYCLIYEHPFSFEASSWMRLGKPSREPVCVMNAGYSSGWCSESFGLALVAHEILCRAKGDAACRFIMAPPSRIEERVRRFRESAENGSGMTPYRAPGFFSRKIISDRIAAEREKARHYLDIAGVMIVALDQEGRVTLINNKGAEMLGRPVKDVMGQHWFSSFLPAGERGEACAAFNRLMRGEAKLDAAAAGRRGRVTAADGREISVEWNHRILRDVSGRPIGMLSSGADVTQRCRMEAELKDEQGKLLQAQKLDAVGRLAGGVAHDFNNQLTIIGCYVTFLLQGLARDDPRRADVEEIRKAAERAGKLTRQLLAVSRKQVLRPSLISLNTIVTETQGLLKRTMREDIEHVLRLAPKLGLVRADFGQLEQVLLNLAVNAGDAMPKGGRLVLETANVEFREPVSFRNEAIPAGRYAVMAVSDTGCGMPREVLDHLFEPFFTTKERGRGTGLGLSTAYGIVKQSGGYITVYSAPGLGSTFKVYLPMAPEAWPQARAAERPRLPPKGAGRILLVEDDELVRTAVTRMLRSCGYKVVAAAGGTEALAAVAAFPGDIDLLLSDVVMPQMDGLALAEKLCAGRPRLRVLFMSGYTDQVMIQRGSAGSDAAFLNKPFTEYDLAVKIREVLETADVIVRK